MTQNIGNAKKSFFDSQVNEYRNNPKKLWFLIRELSREQQTQTANVPRLNENGEIINDSNHTADLFNSFYANLPASLLGSLTVGWIFWRPSQRDQMEL